MDSPVNELATVLRKIRDHADAALRQIDRSAEERSLSWRCKHCGYVKHFTRPALAEVAAPCPKCRGASFKPS